MGGQTRVCQNQKVGRGHIPWTNTGLPGQANQGDNQKNLQSLEELLVTEINLQGWKCAPTQH